jgi:hypothetical protein
MECCLFVVGEMVRRLTAMLATIRSNFSYRADYFQAAR